MANLIDILPEKFWSGLTEAEKSSIVAAQEGWELDLRSGAQIKYCLLTDKPESTKATLAGTEALCLFVDNPKPDNAASWGSERTIRAAVLTWLCTDKAAAELVHTHGVVIGGVKIAGPLDFYGAVITYGLWLIGCALETGNSYRCKRPDASFQWQRHWRF